MIGYLKGHVQDHSEGKMIVAVGPGGEQGTVGYLVTVPQGPSYLGYPPGKSIELFIYTHVREDSLDLYGFISRTEKELFMTLLSVNGIGPKVASGIISSVDASGLIQAILDGDKNYLTDIPGIGKKTAERVVLELKDPLRKKVETGQFQEFRPHPAGATSKSFSGAQIKREPSMFRDAKEALLGLGYREQEVSVTLNRLLEEPVPPSRIEDLIRTALQRLG